MPHFLTLPSGRRLAWAEYGDKFGKAIFYFHGWPSSRLAAAYLAPLAKKFQARIISIDRPGIGQSDFQPQRQITDWPTDVLAVAQHLDIKKFAIMGVSGGGPYAAVCAAKISHFLTRCAIVVGLAPPAIPNILTGLPFLSNWSWSHYGQWPWLRQFASTLQLLNLRYGPALGLHRFFFAAPADRQYLNNSRLRAKIHHNSVEAFRQGSQGVATELQLYCQDWGFSLAEISLPVLLYYGESDRNVTQQMAAYYQQHIPQAVLKVYPHEGHLISHTHAAEILKYLVS